MSSLYQQIASALKYHKPTPIPNYIKENLKYPLFTWQEEALKYFLFHDEKNREKDDKKPSHLMFNLATGTGKTLLMAATMLYYYKKGYKRFLFFANQRNIVAKTEHNFINDTHPKYLFKNKVVIDDCTIPITKVETFSDAPQGIEVKLTTIQKIYNDIHEARENQTTLEDLHEEPLVMLADEAHHLNRDTSKKRKSQTLLKPTSIDNVSAEDFERLGWENMVIDRILRKDGKQGTNKNVLLEFTATIPTEKAVVEKYKDKTVYTFGLAAFLRRGYTKEINLISSTLPKKERILHALLFQWYRHHIALQYGIPNFKPIMLLRSKNIEASREDHKNFLDWTSRLSGDDFNFLRAITDKINQDQRMKPFEMGRSRTAQVLAFIEKKHVSYEAIARWIKKNYQEKNVIITNSKQNKTKKEKTNVHTDLLLNSLEDRHNHIRAIFTVDRLTEGWDVLNLFDIVRLYEGKNSVPKTKNSKKKDATTAEKQLIGRGVRYYPFDHGGKIRNKRKFDDDLAHELRVLEELYYYTYDEKSHYISQLKEALRADGYITDDKVVKTFAIKPSFQQSNFYKKNKIWYNKRIDNPARKKKDLNAIQKDCYVNYEVPVMELREQKAFHSGQKEENISSERKENKTIVQKVKDIEKHIFQKALHIKGKQEHSLYRFDRLRKELAIQSMDDLQQEKLSDFEINIVAQKGMMYEDITPKDKLKMTLKFLDRFEQEMQKMIVPKIGSIFMLGDFEKFFATPKTKIVEKKKQTNATVDDIVVNKNWYVVDGFAGTSEEEALINFVNQIMGNLEEKYEKVYLLRNEEVYKIYDFEEGRGFQPDFLLFLKAKQQQGIEKQRNTPLYYQVLIEAKGSQYLGETKDFKTGKEGWKEKFLEAITQKHGHADVIKAENKYYRLIGLPFFNEERKKDFIEAFKDFIPIRLEMSASA